MNITSINNQLGLKWKIKPKGYNDSHGVFQKTSPRVDIVVDDDGPGSGIPVAEDLYEPVAESIIAAHNAGAAAKLAQAVATLKSIRQTATNRPEGVPLVNRLDDVALEADSFLRKNVW